MGTERYGIQPFHQFAKPPSNTVAFGRAAILFADGKTYADRATIVAAAALHDKRGCAGSRAIGNGEEVRPLP